MIKATKYFGTFYESLRIMNIPLLKMDIPRRGPMPNINYIRVLKEPNMMRRSNYNNFRE